MRFITPHFNRSPSDAHELLLPLLPLLDLVLLQDGTLLHLHHRLQKLRINVRLGSVRLRFFHISTLGEKLVLAILTKSSRMAANSTLSAAYSSRSSSRFLCRWNISLSYLKLNGRLHEFKVLLRWIDQVHRVEFLLFVRSTRSGDWKLEPAHRGRSWIKNHFDSNQFLIDDWYQDMNLLMEMIIASIRYYSVYINSQSFESCLTLVL